MTQNSMINSVLAYFFIVCVLCCLNIGCNNNVFIYCSLLRDLIANTLKNF